jgi:hypothetical protein
MGLFMLECMFISFTSVSALPVSREEDSDDHADQYEVEDCLTMVVVVGTAG